MGYWSIICKRTLAIDGNGWRITHVSGNTQGNNQGDYKGNTPGLLQNQVFAPVLDKIVFLNYVSLN